MSLRVCDWLVHVYRPSGDRFTILSITAATHKTAVNKAKSKIYKMGKLAHFYSYIPVKKEDSHEN